MRDFLELRTWTVFDVDDSGRVLAGHDGSGSLQLVEVAPDGARTPLTALPGACSGRYVVGERAVVVQHDDGGNERAQLSLLSLDPPPAEPVGLDDLTPLVHDPEYIHTLVDVGAGTVAYSTNRRNGIDFDVIVRYLADGAEVVAYDGGGYVVEVSVEGQSAVVTLASRQPGSTRVRVGADGRLRDVTEADDHALHTGGRLLPGGSQVLMSSNHGREFAAVVQVGADGGWTTLVETEHDLTVVASPDASVMLVVHHVDGGDALALHHIGGAHLSEVPLPASGVTTARWSPDGRWLAIALGAPTQPGSVLLHEVTGSAPRMVVDGTDQLSPAIAAALVEPTSHRVPARDGESIPCFVYTPLEPCVELAGSVVISIHGGPEAQATRRFSPEVQALVAAGHTVLAPNVRGSTGYGKRWYSLDDVRLRLESVHDLADLRSWVTEVGGDPQRVALYGGSYGGYMVLAGLSMQPDLWAAGVDVVGISSLVTFLENTSDYRRAAREREYGSLETDRDFLTAASPLTYLDDIRAPLLAIHGANDPRVPLGESEQIKAALDANGVPCILLVYADEGHGLAKRVNRLDAYPQVAEFLATHLQITPA
ncbi:MAG: prolyl oligopeptidase family serine peptidase [Actinomycetota bacterium]|nr:prolyl oligopeptidase family serine peptidase [Actinomycetota bacterium]